MKSIALGLVAFALIVGFSGVAEAAVKRAIAFTETQWGQVKGTDGTANIYRIEDTEKKVVCYVAYHMVGGNANRVPDMECVSTK